MLAREINVPAALLSRRAFLVPQQNLYSTIIARKRSGKVRTIHAPYWPLLNIQRRILPLLEELYRPSPRAMGFIKGRGIRENGAFHVGKKLILNLDIEDYFPSINFGRIRSRLMARPYRLTNDVATTIAKLCTLNGTLPIGAPTSPIIANILTSQLDSELTNIGRRHGCFYTRYADDITFSTNRRNFPPEMVAKRSIRSAEIELGEEIVAAFAKAGFYLNPGKTRILDPTMRQEVCGLTCNVRLNVRRSLLREVRAILHAWKKFGLKAAEDKWDKSFNWREAQSLERSLRGKIEHIIHIRGSDDTAVATLVARFNELDDRIYRDIEYNYDGDRRDTITKSICLIESGDDEKQEWKQGTGFVISNSRVLTNFHNISHEGIILPSIEAIFPLSNELKHSMTVVYADKEKDIAILSPSDPDWNFIFEPLACSLSFAEVPIGKPVYVGGFPSYTVGDSCTISTGEVVGISTQSGQRFFRVSQMIVKGNSGGPVFDDRGQVLGIATRGVDTHDVTNVAFNGCIPLHTIDRVFLDAA